MLDRYFQKLLIELIHYQCSLKFAHQVLFLVCKLLIENTNTYNGWPGLSARVSDCKNPDGSPWPNHWVNDWGNNKKVLANIAGITPAIFTLKGKWLAVACLCLHHLSALLSLCIVNSNPSLTSFYKYYCCNNCHS